MTNKDQCREAFEEHYCPDASAEERARVFRLWPDGRYLNGYTQARYEGWQAARSAPAAPLSDEQVDALPIVIHLRERIKHWKRESAKRYVEGWNDSAEQEGARSAPAAPVELPEPAIDLPRAGAEALKEYFQFCKEQSIQPEVGGAFAHAIRAGAEIAAAPKLPQGDGWIPVGEQLPESGKPVLLDIGKKYPIRAMWAARFTLEADDEDPDWGEWNEDGDMYYCPEGWYEWNEHEETHWRVSVEPLRWMPLPQPPKEQSTKGER